MFKAIAKIAVKPPFLKLTFLAGMISLFLVPNIKVWATTATIIDASSIANLFSSWNQQLADYQKQKYQLNKALPTDLFWVNANAYRIKTWWTALEGIKSTKETLDKNYAACTLSNEEITAILFFTQSEFAEEIRASLKEEQRPSKKTYETTCEKLTACIEGKGGKNLNKKCELLVNEAYKLGYEHKKFQLLIEEANLKKDRYWNGNTEDGAYDLMRDIQQIAKLFFQESKSVTQTLFYQLPNFASKAWNWTSDSQKKETQTNTSQRGSNARWTSDQETSPQISGQETSSWRGEREDTEIQNFIQEYQSSKTTSERGNLAFINYCTPSPQITPPPADIDTELPLESNPFTRPEKSIQADLEQILSEISFLAPEEKQKLLQNNKTPQNQLSTDKNAIDALRDQLESCVKKCESLQRDERQICKLHCLCAEYSSPALLEKKPYHFIEEGALKIRICSIPSKITQVQTTTKTLYTIEEIFKEIQEVIDGLYESGELTTKTRTKEFLDTSQAKLNFAENFSFVLGMGKKTPTTTPNKKQLQKAEEELTNRLKEIKHTSDQERNRYLLLANHTALKNQKSVSKHETPTPSFISTPLSTKPFLEKDKSAQLNLLMDSFFEKNIELLITMKENLDKMNDILNALLQKK